MRLLSFFLGLMCICFNIFNSSELGQKVAINEVAESYMAFNTNYKDTGLFGVYAVAKVSPLFQKAILWVLRKVLAPNFFYSYALYF